MDIERLIFDLCASQGVSGSEAAAQAVVREALSAFAEITSDRNGNLIATLGNESAEKTILLDAHLDRIGFIVTEINDDGFVKVDRRRGAFISVDERNRERAIAMVEKEMRVLLAEARCRGLSRNDILMLVDRIYDEYDGVSKEQL